MEPLSSRQHLCRVLRPPCVAVGASTVWAVKQRLRRRWHRWQVMELCGSVGGDMTSCQALMQPHIWRPWQPLPLARGQEPPGARSRPGDGGAVRGSVEYRVRAGFEEKRIALTDAPCSSAYLSR